MKKLITALVLLFCIPAFAQKDSTAEKSRAGYKKFLAGGSFQNVWSSVVGNTPDYFYKPSLGGTFKVEYYPLNFLGVSAGVGYQQKGAGVTLPDTGFTPPSTNINRLRFRFNYLDFPVLIILRMPHGIAGGAVRLSGSFGVAPAYMYKSVQVWHSVEDGFHQTTDYTNELNSFDLNMHAAAGIDINSWGSLFQIRFVGSFGTKNVFNPSGIYSAYNGKNRYYGLSLGWMF